MNVCANFKCMYEWKSVYNLITSRVTSCINSKLIAIRSHFKFTVRLMSQHQLYTSELQCFTKKSVGKNGQTGDGNGHAINSDQPTSYTEALMHLLRGNIGSGGFAMSDAFKNGGLLLAPILTLFIGALKVSRRMKEKFGNIKHQ